MNDIVIKLRVLVFLLVMLSFSVKGQNLQFVYIQTESKQPFYVKMDKKYLSSSSSGYIIIAKLIEGAYPLIIGSPKNEWPELNVTLNVNNINTGYLLKKSQDQNWSLVNLQTTEAIIAEKQLVSIKPEEIFSNGDEFSQILAQVVNDPSIAQVAIVKKNTEVVEVTPPVVKNAETAPVAEVTKTEPLIEQVAIVKKNTEVVEVTQPVVKNAEIAPVAEVIKTETPKAQNKNSQITKLAHDSTSGGFLITYIDQSNIENDTVKLFIPVIQSGIEIANQKEVTTTTDSRFIDMELQNPNIKADSGTVKKADLVIKEKKTATNNSLNENAATKVIVVNADKGFINPKCRKTATQNEFLKLRKQMAAAENEKNMIKTANKQFINTCFTAEQIKNLGVLFITEEEKYKFYVNAFPYVADILNFGALEDQLTDNYYKTRFKAMLNQ